MVIIYIYHIAVRICHWSCNFSAPRSLLKWKVDKWKKIKIKTQQNDQFISLNTLVWHPLKTSKITYVWECKSWLKLAEFYLIVSLIIMLKFFAFLCFLVESQLFPFMCWPPLSGWWHTIRHTAYRFLNVAQHILALVFEFVAYRCF